MAIEAHREAARRPGGEGPPGRPAELPDRELLARIADGDRTAFDILYRRYHRRLLGYLLRQLGSAALAEEVLNDSMFVVWKDAARFEGRSRASSWIFGIARRQGLKALERRARRREVAGDHLPERSRDDRRTGRAVLRLSLAKALQRLSRDHREVVELTFFHDFTYPEIAEIVGCPVNTVKTRMFHARKHLRGILPEIGWGGT